MAYIANINMRQYRRRQYPEWWLHDKILQYGAGIATAYGLQKAQQLGLTDMVGTITKGIGMLGIAKTMKDRVGMGGGIFTPTLQAGIEIAAGTIISATGKSLNRKSEHLDSPERPDKPDAFAQEAHRHSMFANHSYEQQDKREHIDNWRHSKSFSNDRIMVHKQGSTGNWHVAIRGSDFMHGDRIMRDAGQGASIVAGLSHKHKDFKGAADRIKQLMKLHKTIHKGKGNFEMSGHSLGASMLKHMMSDPDIAKYVNVGHGFNAGSSPWENYKLPKHLHLHINNGDLASFYSGAKTGATYHYHEGQSLNPLAAHSFQDAWLDKDYWEGYEYSQQSYEPPQLIETAGGDE